MVATALVASVTAAPLVPALDAIEQKMYANALTMSHSSLLVATKLTYSTIPETDHHHTTPSSIWIRLLVKIRYSTADGTLLARSSRCSRSARGLLMSLRLRLLRRLRHVLLIVRVGGRDGVGFFLSLAIEWREWRVGLGAVGLEDWCRLSLVGMCWDYLGECWNAWNEIEVASYSFLFRDGVLADSTNC